MKNYPHIETKKGHNYLNLQNIRIYKGWMRVFLMVKSQSPKKKLEKNCFGTKEWSENSGICRGCELKVDCGKVKIKKKNS